MLAKVHIPAISDTIPDEQGMISSDKDSMVLSIAEPGKQYKISRVSSSDKEFFDFCYSNHITVGSSILVKKQYDKNKMTEIEINNTSQLLNAEIAHTIYVKKLKLK